MSMNGMSSRAQKQNLRFLAIVGEKEARIGMKLESTEQRVERAGGAN